MKKGIYGSRMSCWERRKARLPQDHAGVGVIGETTEVVVEASQEVVSTSKASDVDVEKVEELLETMKDINEDITGE